MPGLDGQKMSKSYNNTITLRESAESVTKKVQACPPTPRVRRTDPASRKNARSGSCIGSIPTKAARNGCSRVAAAPASAASNASSR